MVLAPLFPSLLHQVGKQLCTRSVWRRNTGERHGTHPIGQNIHLNLYSVFEQLQKWNCHFSLLMGIRYTSSVKLTSATQQFWQKILCRNMHGIDRPSC